MLTKLSNSWCGKNLRRCSKLGDFMDDLGGGFILIFTNIIPNIPGGSSVTASCTN